MSIEGLTQILFTASMTSISVLLIVFVHFLERRREKEDGSGDPSVYRGYAAVIGIAIFASFVTLLLSWLIIIFNTFQFQPSKSGIEATVVFISAIIFMISPVVILIAIIWGPTELNLRDAGELL